MSISESRSKEIFDHLIKNKLFEENNGMYKITKKLRTVIFKDIKEGFSLRQSIIRSVVSFYQGIKRDQLTDYSVSIFSYYLSSLENFGLSVQDLELGIREDPEILEIIEEL